MDEVQAGARAPDQSGSAKQVATQATQAATQAAGDVTGTAKDQARQVAGEVRTQARSVASDVRNRVSDQARTQNDRLADGIRRIADELEQMVSDRDDSPARTVVSRVAGSSRQMADYLADRGPEGLLREVQDFARRRPGAFLAAALAGGFVLGRLGKSVINASESSGGSAKPRTDEFVSDVPPASYSTTTQVYETPPTTGYGTEYVATGTGAPMPVSEQYPNPSYGSGSYPATTQPVAPDPRTQGGP